MIKDQRTTVRLPSDVHKELKKRALDTGCTLEDLLLQASWVVLGSKLPKRTPNPFLGIALATMTAFDQAGLACYSASFSEKGEVTMTFQDGDGVEAKVIFRRR